MGYDKNIFKIWEPMERVSYQSEKYLGFKFSTMSEYYDALMEYYGIEKGPEGNEYQPLFQQIMDDLDALMNEDKPGLNFKSEYLKPLFKIDSPTDMDIIRNGMSGIHTYSFKHGRDESFECPDMEEYDNQWEDCFIFEVILPTFHRAERVIRKKYGLRLGSISSDFHEGI